MGVTRFLIDPVQALDDWPEVHRAYISGSDQSVCATRIELEGNILVCRRQTSESGRLHVAWPVAGFGRPIVSTSCLPEREEPYLLPVELARGKIVQVRNQWAAWQGLGMTIPAALGPLNSEAHRFFAKAASSQQQPTQACNHAVQALQLAFATAEGLAIAYTEQSLAGRRRQYPQLPTSLGCGLSNSVPEGAQRQWFLEAFNSAAVPLEWRFIEPVEGDYHWDMLDEQVDWCLDNRLVLRGGPLVDLSPDGLPGWLWQWEHDYWNLQSFVCDFVETVLARYSGKIRIWELASRVNSGGALALNEEHRLTLAAKILDVARQVDAEAQLLLRVDQPWGEYQSRGQHKLSPLHFADALVRSNLGLSGISLEIAVGYRPRGTASRDMLDFSRLIDLWSSLGLPLHIVLAFPSETTLDPQAGADLEVEDRTWKTPISEAAQAAWVDTYVPLLLAKPSVVSTFWANFSDGQPHHFPHAGLVRPDGILKAAHARICRQRSAYLK